MSCLDICFASYQGANRRNVMLKSGKLDGKEPWKIIFWSNRQVRQNLSPPNNEAILRTVLQTALTDLRRRKSVSQKRPDPENRMSDQDDGDDTDVEAEREGSYSNFILSFSFLLYLFLPLSHFQYHI